MLLELLLHLSTSLHTSTILQFLFPLTLKSFDSNILSSLYEGLIPAASNALF